MVTDLTPMMRQYLEIKDQHKDAILFFRLGDFYEMFFEDANEATRILHITLTSREAGKGNKVPMCGIPYHAADSYIARLIKHGKKVAICEQIEKPSADKKIVKREIIRVITPGTFIADDLCDAAVNKYILSLNVSGPEAALAYADISTGEFRTAQFSNREDLFAELYKISPAECVISESFSKHECFSEFRDANLGLVTVTGDWTFDYALSVKEMKNHFMVESIEAFGCADLPLAVGAAGALLKYLKSMQRSELGNITSLASYNPSDNMAMDCNSHRNLELIQNMDDLSQKGTLLEVLDKTQTPMGKRLLKRWILNPLINSSKIKARLDSVQYFFERPEPRGKIRGLLNEMFDVERLSNKVSMGNANCRDLIALSTSLKCIGELKAAITDDLSEMLDEIERTLEDFKDIINAIDECVEPNAPNTVKEGGIIKLGYDREIDELRNLISNGKDYLALLQKKEIESTGINSLKVGYNQIHGYYIEVTNANLPSVPTRYVRKQTLVGAERFITEELKEHESKIIGASERIKDAEYEVFKKLSESIACHIERLKRSSEEIARLDVLGSLAETAAANRYIRPNVNDGNVLNIVEGRHPVLEKILKDKEFVPNDILMGPENQLFIITGSNMAGKSTFIRQIALISIMAQMGSFVPAKAAEIGITDRIFTRVGASDRLYRGMSTFMVEMVEAANILNNATDKSFIILDEIGRGTSTFDGVSIAWAMVEFLRRERPGAKTLFATHYHELTELSRILPGIKNFHLAVQEWKGEIIFLYKVKEGSCDESFGIHVAKLAGMPPAVVARARDILENLQKDSLAGSVRSRFEKKKKERHAEADLFEKEPVKHSIVKKIEEMNLDNMTPMEALKALAELKKEI